MIDTHATFFLVRFEVGGPDKKDRRAAEARRADPGYLTVTSRRLFARQGKYRQGPAQRRIGRQAGIATDGAEARGIDRLFLRRQLALIDRAMPGGGVFRLQQTSRQTDAGPTADAGQHGNELLAAVFIGHDVADDAGRGLELVEFLTRLGIDRLQIAFQRTVEYHATGRRQRAAPRGELLLVGPHDLAGLAVPGNEIAHVGLALGRIHRHGSADIGLTGGVGYLVGFIVHADMVG